MKQRVQYNFKQGGWFESLVMPFALLPFYFFNGQRIFLTVFIYLSFAWVIGVLQFRFLRLTPKHIVGIKFLKPFKKIYTYSYPDLAEVKLMYHSKGGWKAHFKFKDDVEFSGNISYDRKTLCSYLLDNNITVNSNDSDLMNYIRHYNKDPQISIRRQIELRKARELARQKRLRNYKRLS